MPQDVTAAFGGARVLITGGVGLIGSALARRLAGLGAELVLLDSMVPEGGANPANIADLANLVDRGRVRVNIADIRDTAALRHLLVGPGFPVRSGRADQPSRIDERAGTRPRRQLHGAASAA